MNKLIENIPQRWTISKLKHFSDIFGRIGFRGYTASDLVDEGKGAITLGPPNIENQKLNLNNKKYISWEKYYESPEIQITNGDILLVKTASVGKVALVENLTEPTTINPQLVVFKNVIINPKFFYYGMISDILQYQISKNLNGGVISTLSQENIQNYVIPLPPNEEQKQIANYLDKKTAKIDETISKNKQLIDLLEEKRTALINQVVTKGLNSEVPMKDSGIEWIGEIPEHWEVVPLTKYLDSTVDYRGKTPEKVDDGIFLVTGKNIKKGKIQYQLSQEFVKEREYNEIMSRGKPKVGDLLFTTEAPLGEVANIDNPKVALAQRIIKMSGKVGVLDNYFLKYYMMSTTFQSHLQSLATGSTAQGIKASKLFLLRLLLIPLEEQQDIVQYLDLETLKIDQIISKVQKNIELLEEYKTSLIHHVVTGKIDIRGEEI